MYKEFKVNLFHSDRTANGRVYEKKALLKALEDYKGLVDKGEGYIQDFTSQPESFDDYLKIDPLKIKGTIKSLEVNDNGNVVVNGLIAMTRYSELTLPILSMCGLGKNLPGGMVELDRIIGFNLNPSVETNKLNKKLNNLKELFRVYPNIKDRKDLELYDLLHELLNSGTQSTQKFLDLLFKFKETVKEIKSQLQLNINRYKDTEDWEEYGNLLNFQIHQKVNNLYKETIDGNVSVLLNNAMILCGLYEEAFKLGSFLEFRVAEKHYQEKEYLNESKGTTK